MADQKISGLTSASTPVAGTEVLPIVQSGSTVKVSVANLTAGRSISTAGASLDGAVTINDSGANVDFRVEGDADANMIFGDASADGVGFGTSSPNAKVHAKSSVATAPAIKAEGTASTGVALFGDYYVANQSLFQIGIGYSDGNVVIGSTVGPSTTVGNTYISTHNQGATYGTAISMDGSTGSLKVLTGASSAVTAPGSNKTLVERVNITFSATTFNETGADVDFRIEGDADANLFFVDASADKIGFGTSTPQEKVEIVGNLRFSGSQVGTKIQQRQTATSVSTIATTILAAGDLGVFVVVNGDNGSNRFCDLVMASVNTSPVVVQSYTSLGAPAARTYARSGSDLTLAMASGTYNIYPLALGY
jgi:hypothetical protein